MGGTKRQRELFWREYGQVELNGAAMTYHRYQRVVEDIAEFAESVMSREEATTDELAWFDRQFAAGGPADLARRTTG